MRHQRTINKLSRTSEHRKALMANMASSLIKHKRIENGTNIKCIYIRSNGRGCFNKDRMIGYKGGWENC